MCMPENCSNNSGLGSCGTLPEGFVCQPGASGPGVVDTSVYLTPYGGYGSRTLQDLGGVTCITGSLGIGGTTSTDLAELSTLVAVGGSLWISDNAALTSLCGLQALRSVQSLTITGNPLLPACWADRLATTLGQSCSCSENGGGDACP